MHGDELYLRLWYYVWRLEDLVASLEGDGEVGCRSLFALIFAFHFGDIGRFLYMIGAGGDR